MKDEKVLDICNTTTVLEMAVAYTCIKSVIISSLA